MDLIGFEELKFWMQVAYILATVAVWVYGLLATRHRVTLKRIEALEKHTDEKLVGHDIRLSCLEGDIKHIPSQADISELKGSMQGIAGRLEGINRAVDLMNAYLINKEKSKS